MASSHREAVKILAKQQSARSTVKEVHVHRVKGYPDPDPIGSKNLVPDLFVKYNNGREKIIEVDTKGNIDPEQQEAFKRSARSKPNVRSFKHYMASDI